MVQSLKEYGTSFLEKLFKTLIEDRSFFITISSLLEPEYFVETRYQFLYKILFMHFEKYHTIPSYTTLDSIFAQIKDMGSKETMFRLIIEIQTVETSDIPWVKEETIRFCRHQTLKNSIIAATQKLKVHDYEGIEADMMNAIKRIDVDHNLDHDYWDDFDDRVENVREGIVATGLKSLDNALHGGLGIGELGVVIAPTGYGKCTAKNTKIDIKIEKIIIEFDDEQIKEFYPWEMILLPNGLKKEARFVEEKDFSF